MRWHAIKSNRAPTTGRRRVRTTSGATGPNYRRDSEMLDNVTTTELEFESAEVLPAREVMGFFFINTGVIAYQSNESLQIQKYTLLSSQKSYQTNVIVNG